MDVDVLPGDLSKRERQVAEIIIRLGQATARDVEKRLVEAPTYSAVRSILRILVGKGVIVKSSNAGRDVYAPRVAPAAARTGVIRALVKNFFGDSAGEAACALLGQKDLKLTTAEAERLMKLIEGARKKS